MTEAEYESQVEEIVGRFLDHEMVWSECAAMLCEVSARHRGEIAPIGEIAA